MNRFTRLFASLVAGVVAVVVVGLAVTALLDPYVWPSAMLGLPAGVVVGLSTAPLLFAWWTVRDERAATGTVSPETRMLALGITGAVAGFVGGVLAATVTVTGLGMSLAAAMLMVGLPVGLLGAVVVGLLGATYSRRRGPGSPGAAQ